MCRRSVQEVARKWQISSNGCLLFTFSILLCMLVQLSCRSWAVIILPAVAPGSYARAFSFTLRVKWQHFGLMPSGIGKYQYFLSRMLKESLFFTDLRRRFTHRSHRLYSPTWTEGQLWVQIWQQLPSYEPKYLGVLESSYLNSVRIWYRKTANDPCVSVRDISEV